MEYTLTVKEDDDLGGMGFVIDEANISNYNPCQQGFLLAHDLLEHHNLEIGGVGNELEAMGSIWFIRGQFGDISRDSRVNNDSYENIASDVGPDLFRKWLDARGFGMRIPNVRTCAAIDPIDEIIKVAKEAASYEDEFSHDKWYEYAPLARQFMISGYQKAVKRYKRIGGAARANSLFWNIAREADEALQFLEYEGQQFKLKMSLITGDISLAEQLEYEEY